MPSVLISGASREIGRASARLGLRGELAEHACSLANAACLPQRLGTKVIPTLDQLVSVLDGML